MSGRIAGNAVRSPSSVNALAHRADMRTRFSALNDAPLGKKSGKFC
jgi:hypothetical protein